MRILIKNLSNTLNYGSMMMGENLISYILDKANIKNIEFYIDATSEFHANRLKEATGYSKIYIDKKENVKLFTEKIKYVRFVERIIRTNSSLNSLVKFYDVVIILGGDDYAETYYVIPRDNMAIKHLLSKIALINKKTKLFMIGQTIGPYTGVRKKWATKAFRDVNIYARDDLSANYVKKELNKEVNVSRDLAFLDLKIQHKLNKDYVKILKKYGLSDNEYIVIVGTGLVKKYSNDTEDIIDSFYDFIKKTKSKFKNKKIVWLSHVLTKETIYNDNYILNEINNKYDNYIDNNCIIINKELLPAEARIILGHAILTITCRMHAAVSSFQMGKPAICLSYSPKFKGVISEGLNMEELVIDAKEKNIWKNNKITSLILKKIDYVINNYDNLELKIKFETNKSKKIVLTTIEEVIEQIKNRTK